MKQCSLHHFTESLKPWLDNHYLRGVALKDENQIVFSFVDGVEDTYEITDCNRSQVEKICRDLAEKGVKVQGVG